MSMSENMKTAGSSSRRKKSIRKSRKGKQRKAKQLSNEDLEFLKKNTKYDEAEIREWYKGFKVLKTFWVLFREIIFTKIFVKLISRNLEKFLIIEKSV